jgi:urate oxidase
MGEAVLTARPEIAEIRLSMPNKHHYAVDLAPFGLDNQNEVFYAADRPYGLIEGTVTRDNDITDLAW